jgi:hypothetical protein
VDLNETVNWIGCDESSAGNLAAPPSTPLDGGAVEQAHMLQRSIGNQSMLLLANRDTNLTENDPPVVGQFESNGEKYTGKNGPRISIREARAYGRG